MNLLRVPQSLRANTCAALVCCAILPAGVFAQSNSADASEVPGLQLQRRFQPPPTTPEGVVVTDIQSEVGAEDGANTRGARSGRAGNRTNRDAVPAGAAGAAGSASGLPPPLPSAIHGDYAPGTTDSDKGQATPTAIAAPDTSGTAAEVAPPVTLPASVLTPGEAVPVYPTLAAAAEAGVDPFAQENPEPEPAPPVADQLPSPAPAAVPAWRAKLEMVGPFLLTALASFLLAALFMRRRNDAPVKEQG